MLGEQFMAITWKFYSVPRSRLAMNHKNKFPIECEWNEYNIFLIVLEI